MHFSFHCLLYPEKYSPSPRRGKFSHMLSPVTALAGEPFRSDGNTVGAVQPGGLQR